MRHGLKSWTSTALRESSSLCFPSSSPLQARPPYPFLLEIIVVLCLPLGLNISNTPSFREVTDSRLGLWFLFMFTVHVHYLCQLIPHPATHHTHGTVARSSSLARTPDALVIRGGVNQEPTRRMIPLHLHHNYCQANSYFFTMSPTVCRE